MPDEKVKVLEFFVQKRVLTLTLILRTKACQNSLFNLQFYKM